MDLVGEAGKFGRPLVGRYPSGILRFQTKSVLPESSPDPKSRKTIVVFCAFRAGRAGETRSLPRGASYIPALWYWVIDHGVTRAAGADH